MKVAHRSEVRFGYPFLCDPDAFDRRCRQRGQAQWRGRDRPLSIREEARFPEDDLMAHVKDHLNPPEGKPLTAWLWKRRRIWSSRLRLRRHATRKSWRG